MKISSRCGSPHLPLLAGHSYHILRLTMRFLILLITSFFTLIVASNNPFSNPSIQPPQGGDTIINPRDADIDKTCRRLRTLTKLDKIAHNETLMDTMTMRDKFAQQRIDWIKSNRADITAKLEELQSNSTLTAECDSLNAQRDAFRECKALNTLEKLVNSTNGQTGLNQGPTANFLNDEQKQGLQQKFEKALLKLQELKANATLMGLCNSDAVLQQNGAIGSRKYSPKSACSDVLTCE